MGIDLSDFVSAGYYLTRPAPRPDYASAGLLPDEILSLSECLCDFLPAAWAIEWSATPSAERESRAARFGIGPLELPRLIRWATSHFEKEFGWPRVLYSPQAARRLARSFSPFSREWVLLGLGLHRARADAFTEQAKPRPLPGHAPVGETGVYHMVSEGRAMTPGGSVLGFEALVYDRDLSCSWLCNGLERVCRDELGIVPGSTGFVETWEEASRCVEHISRDEVGAEPGLWLPWLVVRYSVTST